MAGRWAGEMARRRAGGKHSIARGRASRDSKALTRKRARSAADTLRARGQTGRLTNTREPKRASKQTNKPTSKQARRQTNKQARRQTNKQASKQRGVQRNPNERAKADGRKEGTTSTFLRISTVGLVGGCEGGGGCAAECGGSFASLRPAAGDRTGIEPRHKHNAEHSR